MFFKLIKKKNRDQIITVVNKEAVLEMIRKPKMRKARMWTSDVVVYHVDSSDNISKAHKIIVLRVGHNNRAQKQ